MYYLEKKEARPRPGRWRTVCACRRRRPLEKTLAGLAAEEYRIAPEPPQTATKCPWGAG